MVGSQYSDKYSNYFSVSFDKKIGSNSRVIWKKLSSNLHFLWKIKVPISISFDKLGRRSSYKKRVEKSADPIKNPG